ncbi:acyltransferase family protein [Cellulomonas sp. NTE-D12]|uniref:acyltransferase family protein n=1 Tax=Cellulomonas sp. NTE-D12 TaxID=2962632 RepID=UPI003081D154|nr:acyltransferase [Cellulomonas sp. NTE-D12]
MATVLLRPAPSPPASPAPATAPAGRDTFVDAVRALGTVAVVTLHWLMADATWDGTSLHMGNALAHGAAWTITWVLQVLPLLFFAAGAAAGYHERRAAAAERGAEVTRAATVPSTGWARTLGRRVRGVGRPVAVLAVVWVVAVAGLLGAGVPAGAVRRMATTAPQPLWFLLVWLALVGVAPLLLRTWRRWRGRALAVAVALPLAVDLLRFGAGLHPLAWANVLLVWAVPFLAGLAYADERAAGRSSSPRPALLWAGLGLAVGSMALLVTLGPYPLSMVGMPGQAMSNLCPPTAPVVAQAVAQVCTILLARTAIERWARGAGRRPVAWLAGRSMTVYLWHLTAMFTVVGLDLLVLHERLPEPWGVDWWASRPLWFGAFALVLAVLVRVFGRFERSRSAVTGGAGHRLPAGAVLSDDGRCGPAAGGAATPR